MRPARGRSQPDPGSDHPVCVPCYVPKRGHRFIQKVQHKNNIEDNFGFCALWDTEHFPIQEIVHHTLLVIKGQNQFWLRAPFRSKWESIHGGKQELRHSWGAMPGPGGLFRCPSGIIYPPFDLDDVRCCCLDMELAIPRASPFPTINYSLGEQLFAQRNILLQSMATSCRKGYPVP